MNAEDKTSTGKDSIVQENPIKILEALVQASRALADEMENANEEAGGVFESKLEEVSEAISEIEWISEANKYFISEWNLTINRFKDELLKEFFDYFGLSANDITPASTERFQEIMDNQDYLSDIIKNLMKKKRAKLNRMPDNASEAYSLEIDLWVLNILKEIIETAPFPLKMLM